MIKSKRAEIRQESMARPIFKDCEHFLLRNCESVKELALSTIGGPTDLTEWKQVLAYLKATYPLRYEINGEPAIMPDDLREAFQQIPGRRYMKLKVFAAGLTLYTRFPSPTFISFIFDPCHVKSDEQFLPIITFIEVLADITSKTILLAPELMSGGRLLLYDPEMGW
jgi:hypothetical protein